MWFFLMKQIYVFGESIIRKFLEKSKNGNGMLAVKMNIKLVYQVTLSNAMHHIQVLTGCV